MKGRSRYLSIRKKSFNSSRSERPIDRLESCMRASLPAERHNRCLYLSRESNIGVTSKSADCCAEGMLPRNAGGVSTTATRLGYCHDPCSVHPLLIHKPAALKPAATLPDSSELRKQTRSAGSHLTSNSSVQGT